MLYLARPVRVARPGHTAQVAQQHRAVRVLGGQNTVRQMRLRAAPYQRAITRRVATPAITTVPANHSVAVEHGVRLVSRTSAAV